MKPSHELFRLIRSLSKSEKRFFKLMSSLQSGEKNYIKLFDAIEKQEEYDEEAIKEQFREETFIRHLPSEKNHLYKLILKSLRLFYSENSISALLAEHIQSIEILYNKALYSECSKLVKKAKKIANAHERFYYLFELIKWEKTLLEEEFQAGVFDKDLNKLIKEEHQVIDKLRNLAEYQILYSKINYVFRKGGYVRNEQERTIVNEILSHPLINGKNTALSKRAAATCYYVKGLCAITSNEVEESFSNFSRVVRIFEENPNLIQDIPKQYIKSLGNLFYYYIGAGDHEKLFALIEKMRSLRDQAGFNRIDIQMRIFISTHYFELLAYDRMGEYDKALGMLKGIRHNLNEYGEKLTKEDEVLFGHAMANVLFGAKQYREALRQLNVVLNDNESNLRQDIYSFSKLFNLVIHYEIGNFDLLDYLVKSTERYYQKRRKDLGLGYDFEIAFIRAFKRLVKAVKSADRTAAIFQHMKAELTEVIHDQNERVALEYFDYITWIDAQMKGVPYGELKRQNYRLSQVG
jgi:tetratricopeptide (TPR) repeat protein